MAPLKLENKIKETIEERTIQPSTQAWDKLDQKLGKSSKPWYTGKGWYLGIAASIVAVLFITFYTNNSKDETIVPAETIVTIPEQTTKEAQEAIVETPQGEIVVSNEENSVPEKDLIPKEKNYNATKSYQAPLPKETVKEAIASNTKEEKTIESPIETSFEDLKVEEVVAQIQNLQETNTYVSNAEIDSLLNSAQQEIANQKIFDEHTNTVNAMALLEDVEQDLDRTFRDKVFEALKDSYKNVRTAYANRNN